MTDTRSNTIYSFPLEPRTLTIGRDPTCHIRLKGVGVSKIHALLRMDEKETIIEDAGDTSGILINGLPAGRAPLSTGSLLTIGVNCLTVTIADGILTLAHLGEPRPAEAVLEPAPSGIITIGRDSSNRMHLMHPLVSRFHATVQKTGENSYVIRDLRSTNGTFVNGKRVRRSPLIDGDIVHVGPYRFYCDKGTFQQARDFNRIKLDAFNLTVVKSGRALLDDVSISIAPGEFVAVLGPSGAGKTTLAHALMGLLPLREGTILYNGLPLKTFFPAFTSAFGFVTQGNLLRSELTVRETFYEQSLLRLPKDGIAAEHHERIKEVMELLDLLSIAGCRIGTLSGGEAKRVHFGIELLSSPTVIFFDEPFAGLDPGLIQKFMTLFRTICDKGHTLLLTTHTLEHINSCDRILFMNKGKLAFSGSPSEIMRRYDITSLSEVYEKERLKPHAHKPASEGRPNAENPSQRLPRRFYRPQRISFFLQLRLLVFRYFKISFRDSKNLLLMFLQAPLIAFMLMVTFSPGMIFFPVAFYFCLSTATVWMGGMNSIREIAREWKVIDREFRIGVSPIVYTASKIVVFSTIAVLQALVFGLCLRLFFSGFVLSFSIMLLLSTACCTGTILGLCISVFSKNVNMAISWLPIIFIPQIFFSGILMPFDEMSGLGRIVSHLTITRPVFSMFKKTCLLNQSPLHCPEWFALLFLSAGLILLMVLGIKFRRFAAE
jgi:ABC-type multidrug transport system ATPase subunit/pSer/pThr/pTyr-binding forkhead associated (FHA) protein